MLCFSELLMNWSTPFSLASVEAIRIPVVTGDICILRRGSEQALRPYLEIVQDPGERNQIGISMGYIFVCICSLCAESLESEACEDARRRL